MVFDCYRDWDSSSLVDNKSIDSSTITYVLKKGDINFSKSNARQEPCGIYTIEGLNNDNNITLTIENCDSIATVLTILLER